MKDQSFRLLLLTLWFGILTGLVEVMFLGIKKFYMGQFIKFGPDVIWMAPLADAVLFLVPACLLMLLSWRWPKLASLSVGLSVFSFLGFLSLLLMYYPIHLYAKLLLAAGLAVQAVRMGLQRRQMLQNLVRRTVPGLMALVLVLTVGVYGWRWFGVRQAVAQLPAGLSKAPNVLLIVMDTVRAQSLSLYGYHRQTTPHLERWAQSGVVFERAISASPWTLPSHATMFTGRWPHELSTNWEDALDGTYSTLAEALSAHGYITAGFVANTNYLGYEFGLDRGFVHYEDYVVSPQEVFVSSSLGRWLATDASIRKLLGYYDNITRQDAAAINDHFLAWLARAEHRPFFAFLNYFDAHEPYLPPGSFAERFGPDLPRGNDLLTQDLRRSLRQDWFKRLPAEIKTELDMYDGAIAYIDHQLDRLFSELQKRGLMENTMIIVTSDHGEQFGEHGLFLHGNSLYQPLLHVPLIISFPARVPGGRRVATPVSLRDLPATIVDLTGLQERKLFPGTALFHVGREGERSEEPAPAAVFSEVSRAPWGEKWYPATKGDMQSLTDARYQYIRNGDGREELYDLERDAAAKKDIAAVEENRGVIERFAGALKRFVTER
jgi:arylsulfatase A-like enzyme